MVNKLNNKIAINKSLAKHHLSKHYKLNFKTFISQCGGHEFPKFSRDHMRQVNVDQIAPAVNFDC